MRNYLYETIGTFALVLFGTGAIIAGQQFDGVVTHTGVSITWGVIVAVMIYIFGSKSGAHINPAVSIAFTVAGHFSIKKLPAYIISQLTGALLASVLLKLLFPANQLLGATMPSGTEIQSFLFELLLTFLLMFAVLLFAHGSKETGRFAGLGIGTVVGLEAFFAGPVCGASMNPARSIAPAIVSGHTEHLWIYVVATIAGACLAIPAFNLIRIRSVKSI
ncbi:aquaporin [Mucilaginibacter sp. PPCGB 2223]|uniref:aquaporin n=1 Tax=Mucilaginibacter sp. PPCGB 2223 TaxID=1886027 RepID=UPI000826A5DC|nr:aquaporin [Mucilaginibacter sp. PPCGB 2223]OCX53278.1 aquaporin [Mucilaginibacter sp. PPCGB 2223]